MKKRPFFKFDSVADETWRILYARQFPECMKNATILWLEGVEKIGLTPDRVPNFAEMNERFKDLVGWELVSTDVQFSDGQEWFEHLADKNSSSPSTSATRKTWITRLCQTSGMMPSGICP